MDALPGPDIHQIRRANYFSLYAKFRDGNPDEPEKGMLTLWTDHLNDRLRAAGIVETSSAYLSHIRNGHKEIGNDLARRIEVAMDLPYGWMDADHSSMPATDNESRFVEVALALFRASPLEAQFSLLEYVTKRLERKTGR